MTSRSFDLAFIMVLESRILNLFAVVLCSFVLAVETNMVMLLFYSFLLATNIYLVYDKLRSATWPKSDSFINRNENASL